MSVSFTGSDHTTLEVTSYGSFPRRVYLHSGPDDDFSDPRSMNLSSVNARTFLAFLGIDSGEDLYGELTIPDARRAIIRARATFDHRAHNFMRDQEVTHGAPRINDDGTVTLRPVRLWVGGIDEEYLARQLGRLEVLLEALAEKGATHLGWG